MNQGHTRSSLLADGIDAMKLPNPLLLVIAMVVLCGIPTAHSQSQHEDAESLQAAKSKEQLIR